jgi:hypothetical protein
MVACRDRVPGDLHELKQIGAAPGFGRDKPVRTLWITVECRALLGYLSSNHVTYRLERVESVGGDLEHRQQGHGEERSRYSPERVPKE